MGIEHLLTLSLIFRQDETQTLVRKLHIQAQITGTWSGLPFPSPGDLPDPGVGPVSSVLWASQVALVVKNSPAHVGDMRDLGSIPGLERSPAGGPGNPLQYSCLENPTDRGASWPPIHGVAKSRT